MSNAISLAHAGQVSDRIAEALAKCLAAGSWGGHDRQYIREMALLLYIAAKPKTQQQMEDIEVMRVGMNADLQILFKRILEEAEAAHDSSRN